MNLQNESDNCFLRLLKLIFNLFRKIFIPKEAYIIKLKLYKGRDQEFSDVHSFRHTFVYTKFNMFLFINDVEMQSLYKPWYIIAHR